MAVQNGRPNMCREYISSVKGGKTHPGFPIDKVVVGVVGEGG